MLLRCIGAGRALLGLTLLGAPGFASRLFMLGDNPAPHERFVARIAGNRDLVLGLAQLLAPRQQARTWLAVGAAVDAADAAVSLASLRDGMGRGPALINTAAGAGYAVLELWGLRQGQEGGYCLQLDLLPAIGRRLDEGRLPR
ncbi:MAG: hypothetical protein ACYDCQ_11235 [Dehalococcoidia bacterium]